MKFSTAVPTGALLMTVLGAFVDAQTGPPPPPGSPSGSNIDRITPPPMRQSACAGALPPAPPPPATANGLPPVLAVPPPRVKVTVGDPGKLLVISIDAGPQVECRAIYTPPDDAWKKASTLAGRTDCGGKLRLTAVIELATSPGAGRVAVSCEGPTTTVQVRVPKEEPPAQR